MKPIIFPLKPQMQGPNVAGLHEALTLLGLTISDAEKTAQLYGASKLQPVRKFQTAHQLPIADEVYEATANAMMARDGAFDPPSGGGDLCGSNPSARTGLLL